MREKSATPPPAASGPPAAMDDLKDIKGIGPAIEKRLNAAGIHTFAELAEQTPESLAGMLKGLFGVTLEKLTEQDWPGQAAKRIPQQAEEPEPALPEHLLNGRQHYEMFTVELLLDGENHVRRTAVMHAQTKEEQTWAGWDQERLADFFVTRADLQPKRPVTMEEAQVISEEAPQPVETVPQVAIGVETAAGSHERGKPFIGISNLLELELTNSKMNPNISFLPARKPFELALNLDLAKASPLDYPALEYTIVLTAHNLANGEEKVIGRGKGIVRAGEKTTTRISGTPMDVGAYRIDAMATLTPPNQPYQPGSGLRAWLESSLFEFS